MLGDNNLNVYVLTYFDNLNKEMRVFLNRKSMNKFLNQSKLFSYFVDVMSVDIENIKELLNEIK